MLSIIYTSCTNFLRTLVFKYHIPTRVSTSHHFSHAGALRFGQRRYVRPPARAARCSATASRRSRVQQGSAGSDGEGAIACYSIDFGGPFCAMFQGYIWIYIEIPPKCGQFWADLFIWPMFQGEFSMNWPEMYGSSILGC